MAAACPVFPHHSASGLPGLAESWVQPGSGPPHPTAARPSGPAKAPSDCATTTTSVSSCKPPSLLRPHDHSGRASLVVERKAAGPSRGGHDRAALPWSRRIRVDPFRRRVSRRMCSPLPSRIFLQDKRTEGLRFSCFRAPRYRSGVDESGLSHVDAAGGRGWSTLVAKAESERRARARAVVRMSPETAALVERGDAPKGDVLGTARLAGIQAAKRTDELIPLAHPLPLTFVDVEADDRCRDGTVRSRRRRAPRRQDRRRDGGDDRLRGRRAHRLRHGQGDRARRHDRGGHAAREDRWQGRIGARAP